MKKALFFVILATFMVSSGIVAGQTIDMSSSPANPVVGSRVQLMCGGDEPWQNDLVSAAINVYNADGRRILTQGEMVLNGNTAMYDYKIPLGEQDGKWSFKCLMHYRSNPMNQSASFSVGTGSSDIAAGGTIQMSASPAKPSVGQQVQLMCGGDEPWQNDLISAAVNIYNANGRRIVTRGNMVLNGNNATYNYKIPTGEEGGTWKFKCLMSYRSNPLNQTDSFTVSDSGIAPPPVESVAPPVDSNNPSGNYGAHEDLLNSQDLLGFGRSTTGGLGGAVCLVNNLNDTGSGSLRSCADSAGSKWIRFNVSGNIRLKSPLFIRSNKTIDGRGQQVTISGYGLRMHGVDNIIVHNIKLIGGIGTIGDNTLNNDAVQIWKGSSNIWLDHLTLSNWPDELLDISHASTDITVSWNHFAYHSSGRNYGVLLGSSVTHTQDVNMRITLHHNYFDRMTERGPHARFGKFHFFNNYTYNWKNRAGTSVMEAELLSEDNIFEAVRSKDAFHTETSPYAPKAGKLRSVNDWMINGAYHTKERLPLSVFNAGNYYSYSLDASNSVLRDNIRSGAGWQNSPAY